MAKLCHAGHPFHQPADPDPTADVPQRLQRARSLSSAPGPSQTTTRGAAQYIWLIYATCRLRSFGSPLVRRKRASIHMYRGRSGYLSWRIAWSGFEVDGDRTLLSLLACTMPGLSAGPQTYERASYVWGTAAFRPPRATTSRSTSTSSLCSPRMDKQQPGEQPLGPTCSGVTSVIVRTVFRRQRPYRHRMIWLCLGRRVTVRRFAPPHPTLSSDGRDVSGL